MASWTTTVDGLVRNFLEALNASVPSMQAARILNDDLIGYDDWGRLCDTLFALLVLDPLRSSLEEASRMRFDLPAYETEYESFEDFGLIQVTAREGVGVPPNITDARLLYRFLPAADQAKTFDLVETLRMNEKLGVDEESWEVASVGEVYFSCLLPEGRGWRLVDEVKVELG